MADIFVVDDDIVLQEMLVSRLRRSGHTASCASTLEEGIRKVLEGDCDVVLLDVQLPDGNGLEYIPRFKAMPSCPEVIIITGKGDEDGAKKAITSGAWSYIEKPDVIRELMLHVTRALQYRKEKCKGAKIPIVLKRDAIIGSNALLVKCLDQVAQAASSDASVLITGETGTGKELFARAIHENSRRAHKKFITVDCAALPETLIESILFGHVAGAFTGATNNQKGLVSLADGGTLFLDEIGELPLNIQKTFLRVLQEQSFRPVGSTTEKKSDFRIIAATNIDVEKCVEQGKFRSDLLYRLKAFSFTAPPLKDRKEDIRLLSIHFLTCICDRSNVQCKGIDPDFIEHLNGYDWPGNIRELKQTLEQVVASAVRAPTLFACHLPEHFRIRQAQGAVQSPSITEMPIVVDTETGQLEPLLWVDSRNNHERKYIHDLMQYTEGNVKLACQFSQLSRARLYQLREKHGLIPQI
jgi:two-component system, NtrC family, response regulator